MDNLGQLVENDLRHHVIRYTFDSVESCHVKCTFQVPPVAQDFPQAVAAKFSVEVATVAVTLMEGGIVGRLRVEWKI